MSPLLSPSIRRRRLRRRRRRPVSKFPISHFEHLANFASGVTASFVKHKTFNGKARKNYGTLFFELDLSEIVKHSSCIKIKPLHHLQFTLSFPPGSVSGMGGQYFLNTLFANLLVGACLNLRSLAGRRCRKWGGSKLDNFSIWLKSRSALIFGPIFSPSVALGCNFSVPKLRAKFSHQGCHPVLSGKFPAGGR